MGSPQLTVWSSGSGLRQRNTDNPPIPQTGPAGLQAAGWYVRLSRRTLFINSVNQSTHPMQESLFGRHSSGIIHVRCGRQTAATTLQSMRHELQQLTKASHHGSHPPSAHVPQPRTYAASPQLHDIPKGLTPAHSALCICARACRAPSITTEPCGTPYSRSQHTR